MTETAMTAAAIQADVASPGRRKDAAFRPTGHCRTRRHEKHCGSNAAESPAHFRGPPANPYHDPRRWSTVDPRRLARFPFLKEASGFLRDRGITLSDLLQEAAYRRARARGLDRVLVALEKGDRAPLEEPPLRTDAEVLTEVLAYPVARMLVSTIADPYLIRRYALTEAVWAQMRLSIEDAPFVASLAGELGLDLLGGNGGFQIHFTDFLKHTNSMREKEWKLNNQVVDGGRVRLSRERALRVLRNAVQGKIESELPLPVNDEVLEAFRRDTQQVKTILASRKERFKAEELGKVSITRFPPCMYNLLASIQNHENVPHSGRFAIVTFLHHIGLSNEEIFKVFGDVPDFAADVTRYQIEHITGAIGATEYSTPECATMKSYGLCPGGDLLCHQPGMKHPLTYYRRKPRWIMSSAATSRPLAGSP
ncbi:MAG: DNA primase regulatory subunit PriL [Methanobacteriota archaeon]|nr:MAG: DNA primase regulatory subunit PriL [Euryarchaeota archaeon]